MISTWTDDRFEIVCPAASRTSACAIIWCNRVLLQAAADPDTS